MQKEIWCYFFLGFGVLFDLGVTRLSISPPEATTLQPYNLTTLHFNNLTTMKLNT